MKIFKEHFKRFNAFFLTLSILASSLCLSGCTDKNEIEKLGMAVALGMDMDKNNKVLVSVQLLKTGNKSKDKAESEPARADVYLCTGNTIYDALTTLSKRLSKPIKFSNAKCIVIGKKFAEKGVEPIIDLAIRFPDLRPATPVLVTEDTASDILNMQIPENPISAFAIDNLITRQKHLGLASTATALDFVNSMTGESSVTTCGLINISNKDEESLGTGLMLSGSAVFKKDKLVGFLNDKETRGLQWLKGKVKLGSIIIETPKENKVSLHVLQSKSTLKPSIAGGKVAVQVNIKESSNLFQIDKSMSEGMDFNTDPEVLDRLSKEQDKVIHDEVNLAVNAAQEKLHADIFDFGNLLYRKLPHEWVNMKNDWDETFPYVHINVTVSSEIKQTGEISKTIID